VDCGRALVDMHLLRNIDDTTPRAAFPIAGSNLIEKGYPTYKRGRVYINPVQYFRGVHQEVWEFYVGGYQVCKKWLKDRRGRTLNAEDILHYRKTVFALCNTICIMQAIDERIGEFPLP
jgi:hypothetical protein